ncbi:MAG: hypothetical protein FWD78_16310 [Treponema sp.]|nr:hypothetical protein [Treponema sp.]
MGLLDRVEAGKPAGTEKNQAENGSSAVNFFRSMKNRMGIGSPERNATDTYERGMKIVPACIKAIKNEIPVKQYNIAVLRNLLRFERAEGRLQLTNKRVIFRAAGRAAGGKTTLQHEFAIKEIAGIEARTNYRFSPLYLFFAVIIILFATLVIDGSMPRISNFTSPLSLYGNRIIHMMNPSHVLKARANEQAAIAQRKQAEAKLPEAAANVKAAQDKETKANADTVNGIAKTRRIAAGRDWYGDTVYRTETYRDKSPEGMKTAQDNLAAATAAREKAQQDEQTAVANVDTAKANEAKAIHDRQLTEKVWAIIMTIVGLLFGFGALVPFFMMHKRFGLKLLILNLSTFGFTLSLAASGLAIWNLFIFISILAVLVCIFLFCFRLNLIISIKNKTANAPVDIRRDRVFGWRSVKGTGFTEILPTDETEGAIREIGALISYIQNLDDAGPEKTRNPV